MFCMRLFGFCLLFFTQVIGQNNYPKDYFRSPLDIPAAIAGSFGELRPNHFHSGIDFRTQQKEGLPVFACADGFISRIKISTGGYGKSIYIDHPNGFTTVYAHLQAANSDVQKVIVAEQYDKKSYEIELFPKPQEIIVKKGDLLGYSGNTGSSGGPHLHFEIRDTKTEFVINPLFFGFDKSFVDTKAPNVAGLMAYSMNDLSNINGSSKPIALNLSLQKDGTFLSSKIVATGTVGFAINAFDLSDGNYGKNGIFKTEAFLNGALIYSYAFDSFSFDETKHINSFIDYTIYKSQKQRYQKMFVGNLYPKNVVKTLRNNGNISVTNNFALNYKLILHDFNGNKTIVNIPISYGLQLVKNPKIIKKTPYFLKSKNENSYTKDNISVYIPENAFYEDFYLNFDVKENQLTLHDNAVALSEPVGITFDVSSIPALDREKMFIGNIDGSQVDYISTTKKDNLFTVKTKKLGKFALAKDEIAPTIYKPNFVDGANLESQAILKIFISDNLSGVASYNAYLNGKWILMEYESKLNRLTHNLSDNIFVEGRNDFKLIVKDNMGNTTAFESYFTKSK
jgi:murein DD-endopeptidase MepM/ murein hydrolase activator NlpD